MGLVYICVCVCVLSEQRCVFTYTHTVCSVDIKVCVKGRGREEGMEREWKRERDGEIVLGCLGVCMCSHFKIMVANSSTVS